LDKSKGQAVNAMIQYFAAEDAAKARDTLHCLSLPGQDFLLEVEYVESAGEKSAAPNSDTAESTCNGLQAHSYIIQSEHDEIGMSPTSQLFGYRTDGYCSDAHASASDGAMQPLAEYIEKMVQQYQTPCDDGHQSDNTASVGSNNSGRSNCSTGWDRNSGFTVGYSDDSNSDTLPMPLTPTRCTMSRIHKPESPQEGQPQFQPEPSGMNWTTVSDWGRVGGVGGF
jgi:hypothetical protein